LVKQRLSLLSRQFHPVLCQFTVIKEEVRHGLQKEEGLLLRIKFATVVLILNIDGFLNEKSDTLS
jgi:hypothetical protein